MNKRRILLSQILTLSFILVLSGCGFKLRGGQPLPTNVTQVTVAGATSHSPLRRALEKRLSLYQIKQVKDVLPDQKDQTIAIILLPDSLDRRLLSLFPTGQVAEYELVFSVNYHVIFPNQEPQLIEFNVTREYQDDPDAILAKSRELDLVLGEMRTQAADRIIRLLASQSTQSN